MSGKFITFEGGEGAGKSTQVQLLCEKLTSRGIKTVQTREPGGARDAEILRELLLSGDVDRWSANAEALLNYAARDDHLRSVIRPALEAGDWVVCDRFADSTKAYQGYAGGVSTEMIDVIHAEIVEKTEPDLTVIMDLPASVGLERARLRKGGDRFESKRLEFHEKLREGFIEIAGNHLDRCVIIDATGEIAGISNKIWNIVESRLLPD